MSHAQPPYPSPHQAGPCPPALAPTGKARWILGGLLALIVLGAPAISGNATPPGSEQAAPQALGTASQLVGLNTPARDGAFEFTVTKLDCGTKPVSSGGLAPSAQDQYCLAWLTVHNLGDKPQVLVGQNQKLLDGKGRGYVADTAISVPSVGTLWEQINPGKIVKGIVGFPVPKDVKPTQIQLQGSPSSGGVSVALS